MKDLDETLPMTKDVKQADDESLDARRTFVIYRLDSRSNSSVCQQCPEPLYSGSGTASLRLHDSMQHGKSMGPNDGTAGQANVSGNPSIHIQPMQTALSP